MYERKVIQIYTHTLTSIQRKVIKNEILPLFGMPWKSDNIFYAKKYYLWRTEGATFHIRGRQCAHHRQQEQQLQQGNNIKNKKTENKKSAYSCSQVGKWHLFTMVLFSHLAVTLFLSSHFHSISLAFARYSDISVMNICICLFVLGKCNTLWAPASTCLNQHPIDTNRHKEQSLCAPNHVLFQMP